jgi:hypothetical protein
MGFMPKLLRTPTWLCPPPIKIMSRSIGWPDESEEFIGIFGVFGVFGIFGIFRIGQSQTFAIQVA